MKITKIVILTIHVIIAWLAIGYLGLHLFWSSFGEWEYDEFNRISSPNSKLEAVILSAKGILQIQYAVCVVEKGQPYDTQLVNYYGTENPYVYWNSPSNLMIVVDDQDTRINYYRPVWPSDTSKAKRVDLELLYLNDHNKEFANQRFELTRTTPVGSVDD